jgi:multiple sugar transport system substrate-binding protein
MTNHSSCVSFKLLRLLSISLLACCLAILPMFSQPSIEISMLMRAGEAEQWQALVTKFQEKYPEIRLKVVEAPNDTDRVEDLYTASFLLGNSPYDLIYMDIVWTPKFAAAGWLLDLSTRVSTEDLKPFLAGDVAGGMYEGKLYRMPFRSDAGMLYYRTDLLAKAGVAPPQTFSELVTISKQLQQQKLVDWGYTWQGKQYEGLSAMFVEILRGHRGFWINPQTLEIGLDRPEAIAAVEFLRETLNSGISPPGVTTYAEEETRLLFENGKTAFLRNWPYVFSLAAESPIKGQYGIIPMVSSPQGTSGACQGGWGIGISKTSNHPEAAWKAIEFFSGTAMQKQFVLDNAYVPSRIALFNDRDIISKYPHYPQLLKVVQNSALRPPIAQYAQASDILQRYLSAALTAQMTPDRAMQAAAAETRRLLEDNI